jgi:hypothetical protein
MGNHNSAFEKADRKSLPLILKNNACLKIVRIFDHHLWLTEQLTESKNRRWPPEFHNKHFEEGFSKDLQN